MRDPARIDRILGLLGEVWTKNPDLRLGQLVVNALPPGQPCPQVFYPEDDVIESGLRALLEATASRPRERPE
jgi:hypothetical protein